MRKFLLLLLGVFILFCACEDEAKNPGNYNLKTELNIIDVTTKNGTDISLNVFRSIDSTYVRFYEKNDTLKDESGKPILGEDGKYIVTKDTIYYKGNITAKFIENSEVRCEGTLMCDAILHSDVECKNDIRFSGGYDLCFVGK